MKSIDILLVIGFFLAIIGVIGTLASFCAEVFTWIESDKPMMLSAVIAFSGVIIMMIYPFLKLMLGGF